MASEGIERYAVFFAIFRWKIWLVVKLAGEPCGVGHSGGGGGG